MKVVRLLPVLVFATSPVPATAGVTIAYSPAEGIGPEAFTDSGNVAALSSGVHIGEKKRSMSFIEHITFDWGSVTP